MYWLKIPVFVLMLALIQGKSCEKERIVGCEDCVEATLVDMTGLDGCGMMVQLKDSTRLEPVNLGEFISEPKAGQRILLAYEKAENMASICMAGQMVKITQLKLMEE